MNHPAHSLSIKGLVLDQVTKSFGSVPAVDRLCLRVDHREFIAIVGPTGCGKTTLLRLVAGTEKMDSGHIYIDGQCVNDVQPSDRGVRMVFQDNALWPHMRVFEKDTVSNLSFGSKIRKHLPQRIEETVNIVTNRLGIARTLFPRKPHQLSAGQKQMVGIGRAMTIIPRIFLMDEPLANVDPQNRLNLRKEIKNYHNKMESMTLYVTHNLPEAFWLADRVAIMQAGTILQIESPSELYRHPVNEFVRDFIRCFEMDKLPFVSR